MSFKSSVIQIVNNIPYGRVTTYGTVATLAGVPKGARLVGGVLRFNCKNSDLPWYRVINKDGLISIKNFDYPKNLQKALLEQEGITVSCNFMINLDKYGWFG